MRGPVLILGGRSDIGLAVAHRFAARGHPVQLAARDVGRLAADKADLELRHGVTVTLHSFDVLDTASHPQFVDGLTPLPQIAVSAIGVLGDQTRDEGDADAATLVLRSNFEGPALILAALANRFEERGSGMLIGISSVAGDRGRARNYIYGAAKAGFTAFLSGLRNRLAARDVRVITVLPGFVATRMTAGMPLPAWLTATPAEVATAIDRAVRWRRNVVYVRPVWWLIMAIIRALPEPLFKRMKI
ncbi:MAG: SDR family oxidoreductase [Rhodobacteraceae bacterium]|jgi:short-subunit dehydrogenase|nr:SDR family oxidoreductase [Paracoccaceae bacterium]